MMNVHNLCSFVEGERNCTMPPTVVSGLPPRSERGKDVRTTVRPLDGCDPIARYGSYHVLPLDTPTIPYRADVRYLWT